MFKYCSLPLSINYTQYKYGNIAIINIAGYMNLSISTSLKRRSLSPIMIPSTIKLLSIYETLNTYHLVAQIRNKPNHFITVAKRVINNNDNYYIIDDNLVTPLNEEYIYNDTVFLVYECIKTEEIPYIDKKAQLNIFYCALWDKLISSSLYSLYSNEQYIPQYIKNILSIKPTDTLITFDEYEHIANFVMTFTNYVINKIYMNSISMDNLLEYKRKDK
jgi:hypothetical protein